MYRDYWIRYVIDGENDTSSKQTFKDGQLWNKEGKNATNHKVVKQRWWMVKIIKKRQMN